MAMITVDVEALGDGWKCLVTLGDGDDVTTHTVTVKRTDAHRWGRGTAMKDVQELVRRSFEFLLERERASSILKSFELATIQRYFPEYDPLFSNGEHG
jgi:hypothetical protein